MPTVVILPAADRDLDGQADYYPEHDSPETAIRWYDQTAATFTFLSQNPEIGALRQSYHHALQGVRSWQVAGFERHLIFYRVTDRGIEVIRILYGGRDLEAIFADD